ncbi:MAG: alpha/beta hydrolase-fold protein [Dokdonella sp.]
MRIFRCIATLFVFSFCVVSSAWGAAAVSGAAEPLVIGETFSMASKVLGETRRINVYKPPGYDEAANEKVPVLYMPDGGIAEDFLHVAGLVQVSVGNGTMRPFLLVGIENTERCRDLTPTTSSDEDKKIAPRVGGSANFRKFLRTELMPEIGKRYRTTGETAIVGESLAGLFVVETFLLEPNLFDTYIAFDPSLWWNDQKLVKDAETLIAAEPKKKRTLYLANSSEEMITGVVERFHSVLKSSASKNLDWTYAAMPEEGHATIYHPAALKAFRTVFKPKPEVSDAH